MKAGWKSSEFVVTLIVCLTMLVDKAQLFADGSKGDSYVEYIIMGLVALGYTGVRGSLKKKEIEAVKDAEVDSGSDS